VPRGQEATEHSAGHDARMTRTRITTPAPTDVVGTITAIRNGRSRCRRNPRTSAPIGRVGLHCGKRLKHEIADCGVLETVRRVELISRARWTRWPGTPPPHDDYTLITLHRRSGDAQSRRTRAPLAVKPLLLACRPRLASRHHALGRRQPRVPVASCGPHGCNPRSSIAA